MTKTNHHITIDPKRVLQPIEDYTFLRNEGLKKIKGVPEDDLKGAEESVQKLTDEFIAKIEALLKKKEAEILTV